MKAKIICTTILVEKSPQALPLGAACIASALKNSSLTKNFCDVSLKSFTPENSFENILSGLFNDFDKSNAEIKICAFSVFVWNKILLEKIADKLHQKGIICIAGGPEVTAHPDSFSSFDYTICGEGEFTVPKLIRKIILENDAVEKTDKIQNSEEEKATGKFKKDDDENQLASLSSPYLDGTLNPDDYGGVLWELARGCPFKCSYCYESKGEKTVRLFPMERIKKELDLFAKLKVPQVFVLDPTYNADKKRALQLLNMIAEKTPETFYYFEARAEFIDRQLAQAFTKIPCAVQIGLQSADENVLKLVHRSFNKKQFVKNINILNEEGVVFGFDLIYGLPGENLQGFKNGIDFALSLYPNNLELFCLSVLPGTDLFDRAEDLHLNFELQPPYHIINTDKYSSADIAQAQIISKACSIFYNEGRAVPWFNTICHALKIKPSQFFIQFAQAEEFNKAQGNCCNLKHNDIEKIQISFVSRLFKQKKLDKLLTAATDIIRFNGAISRVQDTGKDENIKLNYDPEYLDSPYASDLQFFCSNIKKNICNVKFFKKNRFADYKKC